MSEDLSRILAALNASDADEAIGRISTLRRDSETLATIREVNKRMMLQLIDGRRFARRLAAKTSDPIIGDACRRVIASLSDASAPAANGGEG